MKASDGTTTLTICPAIVFSVVKAADDSALDASVFTLSAIDADKDRLRVETSNANMAMTHNLKLKATFTGAQFQALSFSKSFSVQITCNPTALTLANVPEDQTYTIAQPEKLL